MKHAFASTTLAACALGLAACDQAATDEASMVSTTPTVQEQACLAAVSSETNNGDVTVLGSEFSEANSLVMIGVGQARAPWRCLVSNDGVVAEVSSETDEGFL